MALAVAQERAYSLIDTLSEKNLELIVELMKSLSSDAPIPKNNEKMRAFNSMQALRKESAKYDISDYDAERSDALLAKYGRIM